jgi:hypothetical protein
MNCVRFHGIDWLRLFPCRSRICNIFKLKMDGGMLPERRFCEKFEFSRYTIWVPNVNGVMDRLQTSGELQNKTSFIDVLPSHGAKPT